MDDPTLGAAVRAFGTEYAVTTDSEVPEACTLDWTGIGLTILFVNFGGADPCSADAGLAQIVEIDGRVSDRWRTLSGLRPGMSEAELEEIYPEATRSADGDWWIVTGKSLIGSERLFPVLSAQTAGGDVVGFELIVGAGGD